VKLGMMLTLSRSVVRELTVLLLSSALVRDQLLPRLGVNHGGVAVIAAAGIRVSAYTNGVRMRCCTHYV